jgi:hypothetical protein
MDLDPVLLSRPPSRRCASAHMMLEGRRPLPREKDRLDLADCDPDAHPDCKRSPGVPVELLIRQQRLLMILARGERFSRGQSVLRVDNSDHELNERCMR